MRKKGWILLLVLLGVAFLMSCGKDTEPDEAKGELVRIEREGCQAGVLLFLNFSPPYPAVLPPAPVQSPVSASDP